MLRLCSLFRALPLLALIAACTPAPPESTRAADEVRAAELTADIIALSPAVDPGEAARAALIALTYPRVLADAYGITDPPLVHNTKVNLGFRPRGLCWHWAEDMEARLASEGFETLTLHRAIANSENPWRIDHSTVIVSAKGGGPLDGIVLDPWRYGGVLHFSPVTADPHYEWVPRDIVFARKYGIVPEAVGLAPPVAVGRAVPDTAALAVPPDLLP